MTTYLLISDSHLDQEHLIRILDKNKTCDVIIHAGDSCLSCDDPLLKNIYVVKGNHDKADFPTELVINDIFVAHGNQYHVYQTFDYIIEAAKRHHCHTIIHGHTHIPYDEVIDDLRIINPGSVMFNRGSYGYGTYAIYDDESDVVHFYHHTTDVCVDSVVLPDGMITLNEFRNG